MLVPQAEVLGVTLPDPDLRWNEDARALATSSEIDWTEFNEVLAGRGPMQRGAAADTAARPTRTAPGCARPPPRTPRKQAAEPREGSP